MKRILSVVLVCVFLIMLFVGCNNKNVTDISETNGNNKKSEVLNLISEIKNDKSIKTEGSFSGPRSTDKIEKSTGTFDTSWVFGINEIVANSDIVVQGLIHNIEYISDQGMAYTKIDILVQDSLKGDLSSGDLVSVYAAGGYMTLKDFIEGGEQQERFPDITEEEMNNTVMHSVYDNEELHVALDLAVFMLTPSDGEEDSLIAPKGSYWRTSGQYSEFKFSSKQNQSRTFSAMSEFEVERPNPENEGKTKETVTLSSIIDIVNQK